MNILHKLQNIKNKFVVYVTYNTLSQLIKRESEIPF